MQNKKCPKCGSLDTYIATLCDDFDETLTCSDCRHRFYSSVKPKVVPETLHSTADIARVREALVKQQDGIDPILKEPFKEKTVLDHCHLSQNVRAALNRNSNAFEGKVFNAYVRCLRWLTDKPLPEILRNLADYLEQDYSKNPYHPGWIKRVTTDFRKLKAKEQLDVLSKLGYNAVKPNDRVVFFQKAIKSKQFSFEAIKGFIEEVNLKE